jgi:hypothetical protein
MTEPPKKKRSYKKRGPGFPPNACFNCGRPVVPAIDNHGEPYMGCPRCVIALPGVAVLPKPKGGQ